MKLWRPDVFSVFIDQSDHLSGLKVKFTPSAVVTEGHRVTLICSTSCPLTDNTNYIWSRNNQPLPERQHKHLVLDPVSSEHAGNYSCAIKTPLDIRSRVKTLTVHGKAGKWTPVAATGVCAALLILIILALFWWIRWATLSSASEQQHSNTIVPSFIHFLCPLSLNRKKRASRQSPQTETLDSLEQVRKRLHLPKQ